MVRTICVSQNLSGEVDFENSTIDSSSIIDRYMKRPQLVRSGGQDYNLDNLTLLDFATHWDWTGNNYRKRGQCGALPYVLNIWPHFRPNTEDPDDNEDYCYARLLLNHLFSEIASLLNGHTGLTKWAHAYKATCLDMDHIHNDDTLPTPTEEEPGQEDSDNETVVVEDEEPNFCADWM